MTHASDSVASTRPGVRSPLVPGSHPFRDDALNQTFEQKGYVVLPLLGPEAVAGLAAAYEALHSSAEISATRQSRAFQVVNGRAVPTSGFHATVFAGDAEFRRAVFSAIAAALEEPLRQRLPGHSLRVANFVVKEPGGTGDDVPLHQDWSFVDERRFRTLNVWCPVVDVEPGNGCMHVVPGSHCLSVDPRAHGDTHPFSDILPRLESHVKFLPMRAGEALFFDGRLLHGSSSNRTDRRRVSTGSVMVPTEAPLLHAVRLSPMEVEQFEVDMDFFCRHVIGEPLSGVRSVGTVAAAMRQHTADILAELDAR